MLARIKIITKPTLEARIRAQINTDAKVLDQSVQAEAREATSTKMLKSSKNSIAKRELSKLLLSKQPTSTD